jgi:hypothetical protein
LSEVSTHQLQIATVFALACGILLSYRLIRPNSRPGVILAFSLLCALVSLCFASTAYLGDDSPRAQVLGSALVGLGVCAGWSVLSLKQADHLWAAEVTFSERAVLRACPYILGTALVCNLLLGLLFPVPVLEFYAEAPLHYLPYKLVLLIPETFCVAFSAYVFFKAAGPSVQVRRIRLQNFSFFLGSAFLGMIPIQAIANACVRVFADRQTRHFLVPVLLKSELVLTVLFVGCFVVGIALYYSKDEKDIDGGALRALAQAPGGFRSRVVVLNRVRLRGPRCNPLARRGRRERALPSIRRGGTRRSSARFLGRRLSKGDYRSPHLDTVELQGALPRPREPSQPRFLLDSLS